MIAPLCAPVLLCLKCGGAQEGPVLEPLRVPCHHMDILCAVGNLLHGTTARHATTTCSQDSTFSPIMSLSCRLKEGRRYVVVLLCGTSGSGKSTLASILVSKTGHGLVSGAVCVCLPVFNLTVQEACLQCACVCTQTINSCLALHRQTE